MLLGSEASACFMPIKSNMLYEIFQAPSHFRWLKNLTTSTGGIKKDTANHISIYLHRLFFCLLISFLSLLPFPTPLTFSLPLLLHFILLYQLFVVPLAYSSEDQLLWRPGVLPVQEVEEFLLYSQRPRGQEGAACTRTQGDTVRDNEQVQQL